MEDIEYEEHLKKKEQFERERYLKEFEEYPAGDVFRKVKYSMKYEYEFVDDVVIPAAAYINPKSKRNTINSISLYFIKINNNICEEYLTGRKFIRYVNPENGEVCFYNEQTGLYFNFNNYFEKAVGMIIDDVYTNNVVPFLEYFEDLKEEDDRLRAKSLNLMLKKELNLQNKK
jgi:hypothetical protein